MPLLAAATRVPLLTMVPPPVPVHTKLVQLEVGLMVVEEAKLPQTPAATAGLGAASDMPMARADAPSRKPC
ncbi:MAG: hypothetical protein PW843_08970 [Azospirillaceae bacterium]|nr:hypothetical protein [Azospirillaceae bacterium]